VFEVLDAPEPIVDRPGAVDLVNPSGRIELDHVQFRYPPASAVTVASLEAPNAVGASDPDADVLEDVSLVIEPGETVALVGATGSGKSTVARLINRFYDVSAGAVRVDGEDVRGLTLGSLRANVGIVLDEPFLFSVSIRDNIAFGRPTASFEDVVAAATAAGAHEFVAELPDGYDTVVGERGYTLSGGQRQRVAIARALITDPRILILDEATASVDASTEREIQAALAAVMEGRTTIVIAHRLSTLALADELVVLERGRVVARGTHDELYEASDLYREIRDGGLARPDLLAREA
jgi:ATP-binding cassette subfamily B protein